MADRKNLRSNLGRGVGSAANNTDSAYYHDNGDGTFDEGQGSHLYVFEAGQWVRWDGALNIGTVEIGTVDQGLPGVLPWLVTEGTGQGQTLAYGSIAQGGAGTTALVNADATRRVKLVSYVVIMDVAGTFKFNDGTVDLSGAMPVSNTGGAVVLGEPTAPIMQTAAINRPLNIITTTGKASGHFSYFLEA